MSDNGLFIEKGSRHCKIIDAEGEVVFRTTNLRDAEHYLSLRAENQRLIKLLESRGMAPHRIYLLASDEAFRGRAVLEKKPAREVVIVAKSEDAVVVRHLHDGREEIVDLEEIEPIEGGSYLQLTEVHDETLSVVVRVNREKDSAYVGVFHDDENMRNVLGSWIGEEGPGNEYQAILAHADDDMVVYKTETTVD